MTTVYAPEIMAAIHADTEVTATIRHETEVVVVMGQPEIIATIPGAVTVVGTISAETHSGGPGRIDPDPPLPEDG